MPKTPETRAVVETYVAAWTRNDVDAAFACLAPDLEFIAQPPPRPRLRPAQPW